jgi:two-component system, NarL family, sensor histidine kinase DesK
MMNEIPTSISAKPTSKRWLSRKPLATLRDFVTRTGKMLPGGISVHVWIVYVHVWLISLAFPIITLVQLRPDAAHLVLAVAGLASFVAFYTWFMRHHPLESPAEASTHQSFTRAAILLVTLLSLSLSFMFGPAFLWLFVGASMVAGRTLPLHSAHLVATALPLLTVAMGPVLSGSVDQTDWLHIVPLALLIRAMGLNMLGLSLQFKVISDLRTAQEELARRAAIEERLRLARDLHDLLGHTLSLIVLKSELVRRLIEKEPTSAAKEIYELEAVARQALREVRQAVAEYRQLTLSGELDGARQMLDAAGITFSVQNTLQSVPPAIESVLAWVVREGITNVIRHSRAHQCTLQLACNERLTWAEVNNDGYVQLANGSLKSGTGLSGLTERVTAQDGTLQAGPITVDGTSTFRLRVEIPTPSERRQQ